MYGGTNTSMHIFSNVYFVIEEGIYLIYEYPFFSITKDIKKVCEYKNNR